MQREAIEIFESLIDGVGEEQLRRAPAPGKWSIIEILAHVAEDELVSSWRYRQMLENDGAPLAGFDQDLWAQWGGYTSWTAQEALAMFRLLREANLRLFDKLTPEQWQRHGIHAERGPITVQSLAAHMAGHDRNHIEQIRRILAASSSQ